MMGTVSGVRRLRKNVSCPLCEGQAEEYATGIVERSGIRCRVCGDYHLTEKARTLLDFLLGADRALLACCVKGHGGDDSHPVMLDDLDIFKILAKSVTAR